MFTVESVVYRERKGKGRERKEEEERGDDTHEGFCFKAAFLSFSVLSSLSLFEPNLSHSSFITSFYTPNLIKKKRLREREREREGEGEKATTDFGCGDFHDFSSLSPLSAVSSFFLYSLSLSLCTLTAPHTLSINRRHTYGRANVDKREEEREKGRGEEKRAYTCTPFSFRFHSFSSIVRSNCTQKTGQGVSSYTHKRILQFISHSQRR